MQSRSLHFSCYLERVASCIATKSERVLKSNILRLRGPSRAQSTSPHRSVRAADQSFQRGDLRWHLVLASVYRRSQVISLFYAQ